MLGRILLGLPGGLALFIYGMQIMSSGLQKAAGDRLRRILEILTANRFIGVLTGALVTILVQSSSTSTVMVVGFVNAGLMELTQAVSMIFGANIGTTVTAQMVSFRIDELALPAIAIGFVIKFACNKKLYRHVGQSIMGFGILFLGMSIMSEVLYPLRDYPGFIEMLASFGQIPLLGIFVGALFTMLVQSSSAATGVIIALTLQGLIDLNSGLALVMGTNIGTCITAILASIGANLTARRTALAHVLFNLIGSLLFIIFIHPFSSLVASTATDVARQVANGHTIFNLFNTLIFIPFINYFVDLIEWMVPGEETVYHMGPKYLDDRMLNTPAVALGNVRQEIIRMAEVSEEMVAEACQCISKVQKGLSRSIMQKEDVINQLEIEIATYLSRLSQHALTERQSRKVTRMMHTINDIERIGDHAQNILELSIEKDEKSLVFSETAQSEIGEMCREVRLFLQKTISSFREEDIKWALLASKADDNIDNMEKDLRLGHIDRLNRNICYPGSGVIYLDLLSNLERIADHGTNIAQSLLDEVKP